MLKRLLIAVGLRAAPPPIRTFVAATTFVGVLPALAYVGWKYRDKILPFFHRTQSAAAVLASGPRQTVNAET